MKKKLFILMILAALGALLIAPAYSQPIYQLDSIKQKQIRLLNESYNKCAKELETKKEIIEEQQTYALSQADTIKEKDKQIVKQKEEINKQAKRKTFFQRVAASELFIIVIEIMLIVGLIR